MEGQIKNYFPGGNTCQGFYSFYDYLPYQADRVFVIKGGPGTGKSTFMKQIGQDFREHGYDLEFHWCSSDSESLDGLVIPGLKVAFLDGTAPHLTDPNYPGAVDEIINLGRYWDAGFLRSHKQRIVTLTDLIGKYFDRVYAYLEEAKLVHDQWEEYYIDNLDFQSANQQTQKLIGEIIDSNRLASELGTERHLFASAFTPQGPIDYFDDLTADFDRRYLIDGRPGTGKATLTKKVGQAAQKQGCHVNYFHCSFDPESIDLITIPQLEVALVDRTPPHEVEASRQEDRIIDMLESVNRAKLDRCREEIDTVKKRYNSIMEQALMQLEEVKTLHDQLESFYVEAMNFVAIDQRCREVIAEINKWAGLS